MDIFSNVELFSVGMAAAAIGILGFVVFFNKRNSITNKSFLFLAVMTILWSAFNFLIDRVAEHNTLTVLRTATFFAVWHAFSFFQLFYVFPEDKVQFSRAYKYALMPFIVFVSLLTLTPLVFSEMVPTADGTLRAINGPAISLFSLAVVGMIIGGFIVLLGKFHKAIKIDRSRFKFVVVGSVITFSLLVVFNFVFPALLDNSKFIQFGAVFMFPFVAFSAYAIIKYHMLDIKVISTEVLAFVVTLVALLQIIFSNSFIETMFNISIFILILIFSIFLLKSVRKEVKQREEIQKLANTLREANARLKELDKMKSEFVSFATHQTRAPITAIKGYTSLILEGSYGNVSNDMKEAVHRIHKSSNSLAIVVEDYLNISRIEMGTVRYDFKTLDLRKLVEEVVQEFTPVVKKDGLELKVDIDKNGKYKAKIDEGKIKQVLTNIIDNSVKYTDKGHIEVSVSQDEKKNKIQVKISDTGVGIKKETMPKLFKKFSRAKDANETNIHGTGLGLYIAKTMVEAHEGGRIWVESKGENMGAQVYVEIDAIK